MFKIGDAVHVVLGGKRLPAVVKEVSYSGTVCRVKFNDGRTAWVDRDYVELVLHAECKLGWPTHYPGEFRWHDPIPEDVLLRIQRNVMAEVARIRRRELWEKHKNDIVVTLEIQKPPYTMVAVGIHGAEGVGFAKCNVTDTWNAQTGKDIAKGRAIADLLDKLVEQCRE